jgi:hypothetical protein
MCGKCGRMIIIVKDEENRQRNSEKQCGVA